MWIKRRAVRIVAAVAAGLLLLDTAAWLIAAGTLRRGVKAWAARQEATGLQVALGPSALTGWPLVAGLRLPSLALGPRGLGGLRITVAATISVSAARPQSARTDLFRADATGAGSTVSATALDWTLDVPLTTPDRGHMTAHALRIGWGTHNLVAARVDAAIEPAGADTRMTATADAIDLAESGLTLPPTFGTLVDSLAVDATVPGLPAPASAAETFWAKAWHDRGGAIRVESLRLRYGALDASAHGTLELDSLLRPAGTGDLAVAGLPALLDALGSSGLVAPRAGLAARGVIALLGDADGRVDLPVSARDGVISIAGFPLGRLAALR